MSARYDRLAELFIHIGLDPQMINVAHAANSGSNNHPYHNFEHLLTVSYRAIEGGLEHGLSLDEIQALAVAGLFHDAGYVINLDEPSNLNIAKTVMYESAFTFVSSCVLARAAVLIDATEFPHHHVLSLAEKIIQDADMMQNFEDDCAVFQEGLCVEKNDPNIADPLFPGVSGFNTDWGKKMYTDFHQ